MFDLIRSIKKANVRGFALASLCAAAMLGACGGGGGGSADPGTLRMSITDAPSCGYDAVNVTIQKIRVHQSTAANDNDSGWSEITLDPAKRVDLLALTNGVLDTLGQTALPAGKYQQMRLVLAGNTNDPLSASAGALANSVVPTGGSEVALKTPSGQQSGLKLNVDIDIAANQMADFVLDFDACKSIVRAGNSGNVLLKPVLKVTPHYISGVTGFVDAGIAAVSTNVSLQQAGVVVKSTAPDSTGKFTLAPVAPGSYDLVVTSAGHATAIVTGVVVAADTVTTLNASGAGVNPPTSTTGTATGAVATGATPIDASVSVTQTLTGGKMIEVAGGPVDSTSGAYSHVLPTAAPVVAPYVAAPGTLAFAADSAVAGKYGLAASSGAVTKTAGPITIAAGASVTTNFTFP